MAASRSPKVVREAAAATCVVDANTTFVQADPTTFRALVQKLTGAAPADGATAEKLPPKPHDDEAAAVTVAHAPPPPPRRPKLQERRRAAPARLELSPPQLPSSPSSSFYYYHHHAHAHGAHAHHHAHGLMHSPVSPMDAYVALAAASSASPSLSSSSSMTPSPHSSSPSCGGAVVMISREEEEREEKAIASKGFYLHASPRGSGDGDRPKLLPLFPVHSPRINELRRG